jgi:ectoine hydroxylase-related dioxygenase (phytanoyl-CoA dioxygenase family)
VDGWDGDLWRFSVNTTLDDVLPGGGAFTVWPGSHLRTYKNPKGRYVLLDDGEEPATRNERRAPPGMKRMPGEEYGEEMEKIVKDTAPVECHAPAGSVIFWHHKMVHSASRNTGSGIRSGVIYEFYKKPDPARAYPEDALERTWAEEARGNEPDMWGDWSEEVQACPLPRADSADRARL